MPLDNKHSQAIEIFDGGRNDVADHFHVPLNQSKLARHFVFDDYGALKTRSGYQTHNSTPIGTGKGIDGLYSFKPSTMSALLLAVYSDCVHVLTGTATAFNLIGSSQLLFGAETLCSIVGFQDLAFLSNGAVQPYKFNGNEFTRAGVSAPTQVLSAFSNAGAGNLTGAYTYVYTGVNSYSAEGDYGSASPSITVTTAQVRVTNIPTAPVSHGINSWNVYRNTANAQGIYWLITSVTNGVTSFTDNVADTSLTVAAPTDQGYLRNFSFMLSYAGRLWGAVDDFLWFSELNEPETFPSTNFIRVGRGDGLNISSIAAFKGMIVVSKSDYNGKRSLYRLIIGDSVSFADPESWYLSLVAHGVGAEAQNATVAYDNYLTLAARDGVYAFDGDGVSVSSSTTQRGTVYSNKISQDINFNPPGSLIRFAAAMDWKSKVWMAVAVGSVGNNSHVWIYDYSTISRGRGKNGAWTRIQDLGISHFVVHENMLMGGKSDANGQSPNGYVFQLDTGVLDGGNTIDHEWPTPPFQGREGHEKHTKSFRWVYIIAKGTGTLNVKYAVDAFSAGGNTWESVTLSSTGNTFKLNLPSTAVGKWIQFSLQQTTAAGQSVTISSLEVFYTLKGLRNA